MKIRKPVEVLKECPGFKPGWKWDGKKKILANPKFGSVEQVVVCNDNGTPRYDQYQIKETPGAIVVPYYYMDDYNLEDCNLFIGLVEQVRPVVKDRKTGEQGNMVLLEVPRGFKLAGETGEQAAKRELNEETQLVSERLKLIGHINPNTAFYVTPGIPVYKAEVDPNGQSNLRPDIEEKILKCEFYSVNKVIELIRERKIICGITLVALLEFFVDMGFVR